MADVVSTAVFKTKIADLERKIAYLQRRMHAYQYHVKLAYNRTRGRKIRRKNGLSKTHDRGEVVQRFGGEELQVQP